MARIAPRLLLRSALVAICAIAASPRGASADDVKQPDHSSADMSLRAEVLQNVPPEVLPAGWALVPDEEKERPAGEKAIREAVEALAKEANVPSSEISTDVRSLRLADGKVATFGLIDVWTSPGGFRKAIEDKAKANGWAFREMGSPVRLSVIAAPAETLEKMSEVQALVAAFGLLDAAFKRIASFPEKAESLANASAAMKPGIAMQHYVLAQARRPQGRPPYAPDAFDKSIAELRSTLAEKGPFALNEAQRISVSGELGNYLLNKGGPSEEARDALKFAVEHTSALPNRDRGTTMGWLYNLACAHGRLKELDPAFTHLRAVLEEDKKEKIEGIDHWRKDPDFDNLHGDPRWEEILKAFPEGGGSGGGGGGTPPPDGK
jgi:hypothetical protein